MELQLFCGEIKPSKDHFIEVINRIVIKKPYGGFWTSTYLGDQEGSDWVQWCINVDYKIPESGEWRSWVLKPSKESKILVIDNKEDVQKLIDKYGHRSFETISTYKYIDFEELSKEYDAIHLTKNGLFETMRMSISGYDLYGWDCESTLWLNFKFDSVEDLGNKNYNLEE